MEVFTLKYNTQTLRGEIFHNNTKLGELGLLSYQFNNTTLRHIVACWLDAHNVQDFMDFYDVELVDRTRQEQFKCLKGGKIDSEYDRLKNNMKKAKQRELRLMSSRKTNKTKIIGDKK